MARFGLVGGAYQSQNVAADNQACINLYVEKDESGAGKSDLMLLSTPGLALAYQLPDSPIRAEFYVSTAGVLSRAFAIAGSTLCELIPQAGVAVGTVANGGVIVRGGVANDGKPACMASSNIQLIIASGGQGYCFTLATNILTPPIATIVGAIQVIYIDGFFIASIADSARFFVSGAEDGINWDAGQTDIVSVFPDNVVSMNTILRTLCLFGKKKSVCYYDSGGSGVNTFPFDVVPGGTSEQGSAATFGIVPADNTLFGIWKDDKGSGVAFRAVGYSFQRISTHAIEFAWQSYPKISDAVAYAYQDQGHTVIHWHFPSANNGLGATWCFDVATGLWFQKAFWDSGLGKFTAHRSWMHMFAFDKHLVGDWASGNIYQMAIQAPDGLGGWNFATDFGNAIHRIRTSPYVGNDGGFTTINYFELMADTGLGPNPPLLAGGTAAYDSTFIQTIGGTALGKFRARIAVSSVAGHTYNIQGLFQNVGAVPLVARLVNAVGSSSSAQTIAAGATAQVSLNLVGDGTPFFYQMETQNIGDQITAIGFNALAFDETAGTAIVALSATFQGAWAAVSGAVVTLAQNQQNPLSTPRGPQVLLQWSDDGGRKYSNGRIIDLGQIGQFKKRLIQRLLGRFWGSIGRIWKLTYSDPAPLRIVDAVIDPPQQRLAVKLREQA